MSSKAKKQIPPEYKCSRCHKDMRKEGNEGCQCNKRHEQFIDSKSGGRTNQQDFIYHGTLQ